MEETIMGHIGLGFTGYRFFEWLFRDCLGIIGDI